MISPIATRHNTTHTNNFRGGRAWKQPVDAIVIHVTEGNASSVRSWFADATAMVSAHYMVTAAGAIESFVDEEDTAYHAGQLVTPSSALVLDRHAHGGYTPNSYAIGIEHEGDGTHELTSAQRAASYALIRDICTRHPVLLDRTHVLGHHEIKASKTCPGAIDVDRIVRDLAGSVEPKPPEVAATYAPVYSNTLGWIVPVTVTSDTAWTFATIKEVRSAIAAGRVPTTMEAGAPLSQMTQAKR